MYVYDKDVAIDRIQDISIWRYMDFWKFLKVINSSSIFFATVDMLGDNNEGRFPNGVLPYIDEHLKTKEKGTFNKTVRNLLFKFLEQDSKDTTLISSWTAADNESFAMWKMYAKDRLGVAIKTSFNGLKNSFKNTKEDVFIGQVEYYDETYKGQMLGKFPTILTKAIYYSFEREVRCIIQLNDDKKKAPKNIHVDLTELIEEVYLSPFAFESGLLELVEILRAKHDLNFDIKMSGVNDSWL